MTQFLPPNLLALFAPREPIPYLPPPCKLPHEKKQKGYDGVGHFLSFFEHPSETPPPTRVETRAERLERRRRERAEQVAYKLEREIAVWKPADDEDATADPFKTLFIARINYDTSESKLRREFEGYGPIKKIRMIYNSDNGKPRGYAFIEYEHERDMHSAYKHADGKKIDGKRVLVDVERARTVKGWLPRRLGGGLGGTRRGGPDVNIKHSGREDNERERERYRLERERDDRRGGGGGDRERGGVSAERTRRRSRSRSPRRREREPREPREPREREPRPDREREPRDRDRDRDRERERDRDKDIKVKEEGEDKKERRRKRSRSRSERRRERRERDKDRGDRDKDRDRERDKDRKRSRRDKERDRDRKEPKIKPEDIKIKEEPIDDYPDFTLPVAPENIKLEAADNADNSGSNGDKYNPEEPNGDDQGY